MIPHLITALTGPLLEIEKKILASETEIEAWLSSEWQEYKPPFYCSVDLRNAGFKIAPIDTNLFPGGFNNLLPASLKLATSAIKEAVSNLCPNAKKILLIPENHTRNSFYLENVASLLTIAKEAGLEVRLGSLSKESSVDSLVSTDLNQDTKVASLQKIIIEPSIKCGKKHNRLGLSDFDPDIILLNNDLSAGVPKILKHLIDQVILPPLHAGWVTRRKSSHFAAYDEVAKKFAQILNIDPWMVNSYFVQCSNMDLQEQEKTQELQENVNFILEKIKKKYKEYKIDETPYVVIKADAGTYGMGVMTVKDAAEISSLTRKERNKMSVIKDGLAVTDLIIQEGIASIEKIHASVSEPVVYMVERYVIGSFYRVHNNKAKDENLNSPGMHFSPMNYVEQANMNNQPNRFYMYAVISRLALLAAAIELEGTEPEERL